MTTARWAMAAMACAALLGAAAQILIKKADVQFNLSVLQNWPLIAGMSLYGAGFIINIFAYRNGEASVLYPIIALSYLFVIVLAAVFLEEKLTWLKIAGSLVILCGVVLIAI